MSTASAARPVLTLTGVTWKIHGRRYRLTPEPLTMSAGQTAVVAADGPARAEAFTDILLGLADPIEGEIRLGDDDITAEEPQRRRIGLIPAGGGLLPNLTVGKNIALAARSRPSPELLPGNILFEAKRMRVEAFLRRHPHELAPDDRARVALARAMLRPRLPKVMLIEDRTGHGPCHPAVSAARDADPRLAVLVITDDRTRVPTLGSAWEVVYAPEP